MNFQEEMEKEKQNPDFVFHLDGSAHYKYKETGCCSPHGKTCTCGGYMHYQPVYGGYFYQCETCNKQDI